MLGEARRLVCRRRRAALGWTQRELARAAGCTERDIARLETEDDPALEELRARALAAMAATDDPAEDPLADPALTEEHRALLARALWRRRAAERLAEAEQVDAGDVAHVLRNLEDDPAERLRRSFRRAGLRRSPTH
ncbi:MAG: helix-turn-helix domain-containing protein [Myxococcota bacterium]